MSVEDTKEELREYGKWAAIKANKAMWYQAMHYYPSNIKSDPIMITLERAYTIDSALASMKQKDPKCYKALTGYLIGRKSHRDLAKELRCSYKQAGIHVNNAIYMIHGILIAQNI